MQEIELLRVLDPSGTVRHVPTQDLSQAITHGGYYLEGGRNPEFVMPDGESITAPAEDAPDIIAVGGMLQPMTKIRIVDPEGNIRDMPSSEVDRALSYGGTIFRTENRTDPGAPLTDTGDTKPLGTKTWKTAFSEFFSKGMIPAIPFLNAVEVFDSIEKLSLMRRVNAGEKLTPKESAQLGAWQEDASRDQTWGYKMWDQVFRLPAYSLEFGAATAAIRKGSELAVKPVLKNLSKASIDDIAETAGKVAMQRINPKVLAERGINSADDFARGVAARYAGEVTKGRSIANVLEDVFQTYTPLQKSVARQMTADVLGRSTIAEADDFARVGQFFLRDTLAAVEHAKGRVIEGAAGAWEDAATAVGDHLVKAVVEGLVPRQLFGIHRIVDSYYMNALENEITGEKPDDFLEGFLKAYGDMAIENISEQTGELLGFLTGPALRSGKDAFKSSQSLLKAGFLESIRRKFAPEAEESGMKAVYRWLFGISGGEPGALARMGWNGVIGELAEEGIGGALRMATGIVEPGLPSIEDVTAMAAAFALNPLAAVGAIGGTRQRRVYEKVNEALRKRDDVLTKARQAAAKADENIDIDSEKQPEDYDIYNLAEDDVQEVADILERAVQEIKPSALNRESDKNVVRGMRGLYNWVNGNRKASKTVLEYVNDISRDDIRTRLLEPINGELSRKEIERLAAYYVTGNPAALNTNKEDVPIINAIFNADTRDRYKDLGKTAVGRMYANYAAASGLSQEEIDSLSPEQMVAYGGMTHGIKPGAIVAKKGTDRMGKTKFMKIVRRNPHFFDGSVVLTDTLEENMAKGDGAKVLQTMGIRKLTDTDIPFGISTAAPGGQERLAAILGGRGQTLPDEQVLADKFSQMSAWARENKVTLYLAPMQIHATPLEETIGSVYQAHTKVLGKDLKSSGVLSPGQDAGKIKDNVTYSLSVRRAMTKPLNNGRVAVYLNVGTGNFQLSAMAEDMIEAGLNKMLYYNEPDTLTKIENGRANILAQARRTLDDVDTTDERRRAAEYVLHTFANTSADDTNKNEKRGKSLEMFSKFMTAYAGYTESIRSGVNTPRSADNSVLAFVKLDANMPDAYEQLLRDANVNDDLAGVTDLILNTVALEPHTLKDVGFHRSGLRATSDKGRKKEEEDMETLIQPPSEETQKIIDEVYTRFAAVQPTGNPAGPRYKDTVTGVPYKSVTEVPAKDPYYAFTKGEFIDTELKGNARHTLMYHLASKIYTLKHDLTMDGLDDLLGNLMRNQSTESKEFLEGFSSTGRQGMHESVETALENMKDESGNIHVYYYMTPRGNVTMSTSKSWNANKASEMDRGGGLQEFTMSMETAHRLFDRSIPDGKGYSYLFNVPSDAVRRNNVIELSTDINLPETRARILEEANKFRRFLINLLKNNRQKGWYFLPEITLHHNNIAGTADLVMFKPGQDGHHLFRVLDLKTKLYKNTKKGENKASTKVNNTLTPSIQAQMYLGMLLEAFPNANQQPLFLPDIIPVSIGKYTNIETIIPTKTHGVRNHYITDADAETYKLERYKEDVTVVDEIKRLYGDEIFSESTLNRLAAAKEAPRVYHTSRSKYEASSNKARAARTDTGRGEGQPREPQDKRVAAEAKPNATGLSAAVTDYRQVLEDAWPVLKDKTQIQGAAFLEAWTKKANEAVSNGQKTIKNLADIHRGTFGWIISDPNDPQKNPAFRTNKIQILVKDPDVSDMRLGVSITNNGKASVTTLDTPVTFDNYLRVLSEAYKFAAENAPKVLKPIGSLSVVSQGLPVLASDAPEETTEPRDDAQPAEPPKPPRNRKKTKPARKPDISPEDTGEAEEPDAAPPAEPSTGRRKVKSRNRGERRASFSEVTLNYELDDPAFNEHVRFLRDEYGDEAANKFIQHITVDTEGDDLFTHAEDNGIRIDSAESSERRLRNYALYNQPYRIFRDLLFNETAAIEREDDPDNPDSDKYVSGDLVDADVQELLLQDMLDISNDNVVSRIERMDKSVLSDKRLQQALAVNAQEGENASFIVPWMLSDKAFTTFMRNPDLEQNKMEFAFSETAKSMYMTHIHNVIQPELTRLRHRENRRLRDGAISEDEFNSAMSAHEASLRDNETLKREARDRTRNDIAGILAHINTTPVLALVEVRDKNRENSFFYAANATIDETMMRDHSFRGLPKNRNTGLINFFNLRPGDQKERIGADPDTNEETKSVTKANWTATANALGIPAELADMAWRSRFSTPKFQDHIIWHLTEALRAEVIFGEKQDPYKHAQNTQVRFWESIRGRMRADAGQEEGSENEPPPLPLLKVFYGQFRKNPRHFASTYINAEGTRSPSYLGYNMDSIRIDRWIRQGHASKSGLKNARLVIYSGLVSPSTRGVIQKNVKKISADDINGFSERYYESTGRIVTLLPLGDRQYEMGVDFEKPKGMTFEQAYEHGAKQIYEMMWGNDWRSIVPETGKDARPYALFKNKSDLNKRSQPYSSRGTAFVPMLDIGAAGSVTIIPYRDTDANRFFNEPARSTEKITGVAQPDGTTDSVAYSTLDFNRRLAFSAGEGGVNDPRSIKTVVPSKDGEHKWNTVGWSMDPADNPEGLGYDIVRDRLEEISNAGLSQFHLASARAVKVYLEKRGDTVFTLADREIQDLTKPLTEDEIARASIEVPLSDFVFISALEHSIDEDITPHSQNMSVQTKHNAALLDPGNEIPAIETDYIKHAVNQVSRQYRQEDLRNVLNDVNDVTTGALTRGIRDNRMRPTMRGYLRTTADDNGVTLSIRDEIEWVTGLTGMTPWSPDDYEFLENNIERITDAVYPGLMLAARTDDSTINYPQVIDAVVQAGIERLTAPNAAIMERAAEIAGVDAKTALANLYSAGDYAFIDPSYDNWAIGEVLLNGEMAPKPVIEEARQQLDALYGKDDRIEPALREAVKHSSGSFEETRNGMINRILNDPEIRDRYRNMVQTLTYFDDQAAQTWLSVSRMLSARIRRNFSVTPKGTRDLAVPALINTRKSLADHVSDLEAEFDTYAFISDGTIRTEIRNKFPGVLDYRKRSNGGVMPAIVSTGKIRGTREQEVFVVDAPSYGAAIDKTKTEVAGRGYEFADYYYGANGTTQTAEKANPNKKSRDILAHTGDDFWLPTDEARLNRTAIINSEEWVPIKVADGRYAVVVPGSLGLTNRVPGGPGAHHIVRLGFFNRNNNGAMVMHPELVRRAGVDFDLDKWYTAWQVFSNTANDRLGNRFIYTMRDLYQRNKNAWYLMTEISLEEFDRSIKKFMDKNAEKHHSEHEYLDEDSVYSLATHKVDNNRALDARGTLGPWVSSSSVWAEATARGTFTFEDDTYGILNNVLESWADDDEFADILVDGKSNAPLGSFGLVKSTDDLTYEDKKEMAMFTGQATNKIIDNLKNATIHNFGMNRHTAAMVEVLTAMTKGTKVLKNGKMQALTPIERFIVLGNYFMNTPDGSAIRDFIIRSRSDVRFGTSEEEANAMGKNKVYEVLSDMMNDLFEMGTFLRAGDSQLDVGTLAYQYIQNMRQLEKKDAIKFGATGITRGVRFGATGMLTINLEYLDKLKNILDVYKNVAMKSEVLDAIVTAGMEQGFTKGRPTTQLFNRVLPRLIAGAHGLRDFETVVKGLQYQITAATNDAATLNRDVDRILGIMGISSDEMPGVYREAVAEARAAYAQGLNDALRILAQGKDMLAEDIPTIGAQIFSAIATRMTIAYKAVVENVGPTTRVGMMAPDFFEDVRGDYIRTYQRVIKALGLREIEQFIDIDNVGTRAGTYSLSGNFQIKYNRPPTVEGTEKVAEVIQGLPALTQYAMAIWTAGNKNSQSAANLGNLWDKFNWRDILGPTTRHNTETREALPQSMISSIVRLALNKVALAQGAQSLIDNLSIGQRIAKPDFVRNYRVENLGEVLAPVLTADTNDTYFMTAPLLKDGSRKKVKPVIATVGNENKVTHLTSNTDNDSIDKALPWMQDTHAGTVYVPTELAQQMLAAGHLLMREMHTARDADKKDAAKNTEFMVTALDDAGEPIYTGKVLDKYELQERINVLKTIFPLLRMWDIKKYRDALMELETGAFSGHYNFMRTVDKIKLGFDLMLADKNRRGNTTFILTTPKWSFTNPTTVTDAVDELFNTLRTQNYKSYAKYLLPTEDADPDAGPKYNEKKLEYARKTWLKPPAAPAQPPDGPADINIYYGSNENRELSNFAERRFTDPDTNIEFFSVEQYFQYNKVSEYMSTDTDTGADALQSLANEILNTDSGASLKRKGGTRLTGVTFDAERWEADKAGVMADGIRMSFDQNDDAKKRLMTTGNAKLTHTQDKGEWGTLFPKLLMEYRDSQQPGGYSASEVTVGDIITPDKPFTPDPATPEVIKNIMKQLRADGFSVVSPVEQKLYMDSLLKYMGTPQTPEEDVDFIYRSAPALAITMAERLFGSQLADRQLRKSGTAANSIRTLTNIIRKNAYELYAHETGSASGIRNFEQVSTVLRDLMSTNKKLVRRIQEGSEDVISSLLLDGRVSDITSSRKEGFEPVNFLETLQSHPLAIPTIEALNSDSMIDYAIGGSLSYSPWYTVYRDPNIPLHDLDVSIVATQRPRIDDALRKQGIVSFGGLLLPKGYSRLKIDGSSARGFDKRDVYVDNSYVIKNASGVTVGERVYLIFNDKTTYEDVKGERGLILDPVAVYPFVGSIPVETTFMWNGIRLPVSSVKKGLSAKLSYGRPKDLQDLRLLSAKRSMPTPVTRLKDVTEGTTKRDYSLSEVTPTGNMYQPLFDALAEIQTEDKAIRGILKTAWQPNALLHRLTKGIDNNKNPEDHRKELARIKNIVSNALYKIGWPDTGDKDYTNIMAVLADPLMVNQHLVGTQGDAYQKILDTHRRIKALRDRFLPWTDNLGMVFGRIRAHDDSLIAMEDGELKVHSLLGSAVNAVWSKADAAAYEQPSGVVLTDEEKTDIDNYLNAIGAAMYVYNGKDNWEKAIFREVPVYGKMVKEGKSIMLVPEYLKIADTIKQFNDSSARKKLVSAGRTDAQLDAETIAKEIRNVFSKAYTGITEAAKDLQERSMQAFESYYPLDAGRFGVRSELENERLDKIRKELLSLNNEDLAVRMSKSERADIQITKSQLEQQDTRLWPGPTMFQRKILNTIYREYFPKAAFVMPANNVEANSRIKAMLEIIFLTETPDNPSLEIFKDVYRQIVFMNSKLGSALTPSKEMSDRLRKRKFKTPEALHEASKNWEYQLFPKLLSPDKAIREYLNDSLAAISNRLIINWGVTSMGMDGKPNIIYVPNTKDVDDTVITRESLRASASILAQAYSVPREENDIATISVAKNMIENDPVYKKVSMNKMHSAGSVYARVGDGWQGWGESTYAALSHLLSPGFYVQYPGWVKEFAQVVSGDPESLEKRNVIKDMLDAIQAIKFSNLGASLFFTFSAVESFMAAGDLKKFIENPSEFIKNFSNLREEMHLGNVTGRYGEHLEKLMAAGYSINIGRKDESVLALSVPQKMVKSLQKREGVFKYPAMFLADIMERQLAFSKWMFDDMFASFKLNAAMSTLTEIENIKKEHGKGPLTMDEYKQVADYTNNAFGGQDWTRFWWANKKALQVLNFSVFAPNWTASSFRIAGGNVLMDKANVGPKTGEYERYMQMYHYWPQMIGLTLLSWPLILQASIYAAFGDPDEEDTPVPLMNEQGRMFHVDITPLLRTFPWYDGGASGDRRYYIRWAKQVYEVFDPNSSWAADALNLKVTTLFRKLSTPARLAVEMTIGPVGTDYTYGYEDMGLVGLFWSDEDGFMGSRTGHVLSSLMPYSLSQMVSRGGAFPFGILGPVSKGASKFSLIEEATKALKTYASDASWNEIKQNDESKAVLAGVIPNVIASAAANGYTPDSIINPAKATVLGELYRQMGEAVEKENIPRIERLAARILRVNGSLRGFKGSTSRKDSGYFKDTRDYSSATWRIIGEAFGGPENIPYKDISSTYEGD